MFSPTAFRKASVVLAAMLLGMFTAAAVQAAVPNLTVTGSDGAPITAYRWVLQEDTTYHVTPGVAPPAGTNDPSKLPLSLRFHTSHIPVVDKGTNAQPLPDLDPLKHYYVSVMPIAAGTYTIGGAQIAPGQTSVMLVLNKLPLPTAQITVLVYHDNRPLNNAPELPEEDGLPGFNIFVEDAGGRYGASAGEMAKDAFDNPLGTEYYTCAGPIQPGVANCSVVPAPPLTSPQLDATGAPIVKDWHPMVTGPCPGPTCGQLTIKNLGPGKYGIKAIPPSGTTWQQTHTIEGTRVIDAWVKANEPPFFAEFGPPGWHVFIGFIQPFNSIPAGGSATIKGCVVNNHLARPPEFAFYNGAALEHTTPWVGLNNRGGAPGLAEAIYAQPTADGCFSIAGVPANSATDLQDRYQLVVWDENLDVVFASYGLRVNPNGNCSTPSGSCDLGEVPVFQWFTSTHHYVFDDLDGDGFRDDGEPGILEQAVNIRWRDGSINQSAPTDLEGFVPFDEVFPFFHWQVAEVDFLRYKATGVTVVVDDGGAINPADAWTFNGILNPQLQFCNADDLAAAYPGCKKIGDPRINPNSGDNKSRTETGPVLTQGFQGFLGQTSAFAWGKQAYGPDENGGISGIVFYDTTRAEDDPRNNGPEVWQPGIPNVTVRLWNSTGTVLLNETQTDSWDASQPTGCQGDVFYAFPAFNNQGQPIPGSGTPTDCYDGLRNFNQVRPGVFDGGYAFTECYLLGGACVAQGTNGAVLGPLPEGEYRVEVVLPLKQGGAPDNLAAHLYEVVKEEDKNVDFGDTYVPSPNLVAPACVGVRTELGYPAAVPTHLTLFPSELVEAAYASQVRPLCNKKQVLLGNGANAAADFFLFTEVPIAGQISGMILDDTANEFDPTSPNFGEKYAPPFVPVAIKDWTGREIGRTYADVFGRYNTLVPSTYTANSPKPSGMDPNMVITCMNARTRPNGTVDPFHNPSYSEFCYTFQYMPGVTTYLDTPVVPVGAFAGPNQNQLDCELPNATPKIKQVSVNNLEGGGPLVTTAGQQITIQSMGTVLVDNPEYCPGPPFTTVEACPVINTIKQIPRDYGFGTQGPQSSVRLLNGGGAAIPLTIISWSNTQIVANAGSLANGPYQLSVNRHVPASGGQPATFKPTLTGITVEYKELISGPATHRVTKAACNGTPLCYDTIQAAIDAASAGDTILVGPGTYPELVIMYKPVKLQGWGEGVTIIDAVSWPGEKRLAWRQKIESLVTSGAIDPLDGQEVAFGGIEPPLFFTEEAAGVFVAGNGSAWSGTRIDGFAITGSDSGGGVVVNGRVDGLTISNNRVRNNTGFFGGGVRVGHPELVNLAQDNYVDALTDNITIRNNQITDNGGLGGAGGGVSICTGADNYRVTSNFICGNYQMGNGGGIGHLGLSTGGTIENNTILFNESFNQGLTVDGGGIYIAGQPPIPPALTQSPGAGNVTVNANLILGNLAGAGDGGGIRLQSINGPAAGAAYTVNLTNNMIVNNVAGMAGGGISMTNAGNARVLHNTVARNDSTATSGQAFTPGNPDYSNPKPAGIVKSGTGTPVVDNNIIYQNRSFFFVVGTNTDPPTYTLRPANQWVPPATTPPTPVPPFFWDLSGISPTFSLTSAPGLGGQGNISGNPRFLLPYYNAQGGTTVIQPEATTPLTPPPAFDEGGNFIRVRFGPLSQTLCTAYTGTAPNQTCASYVLSDYHLSAANPPNQSAAVNAGRPGAALVTPDYDGQTRPLGNRVDIGADEVR